MVRRSKLENSPPYGKTSSATLWSFSHCQKTITCHLSVIDPRNNENPPSLSCRPFDEVSGNRRTRTQLRKTATGDHRRRTRMGGREGHQLPTPRTTQEAPIPCSMERVSTVRRFLGSRVGPFRSRPDRRLLRHTLPRSSATLI